MIAWQSDRSAPVTTRRIIFTRSGKAEFGLLAALLVLLGGVGGLIWLVIKNYHEPQPVAVDRPGKEKPAAAPAPIEHKPQPGLTKSRTSVTIVADPKTQEALDVLRKSAVDDSKPLKITKKKEASPEPAKKADLAADLQIDGQVIDLDSPEVQDALTILKRYVGMKAWKDKLTLVHQSAEVGPLMQEFYGSQGLADPVLTGLISATNMRVGNLWVLALSFGCGDRLNMVVHANFHRSPAGLRLDWESFVGFSDKSMSEFRATRSIAPVVFRVLAVPDDYYNFEFGDASKYLSVRLYNPNGDDYVHGYCLRESSEGKKLVQILGDSARSSSVAASGNGLRAQSNGHFPITVQLAFPEKSQSDRCVRIDKFISAWWLALDVEKQTTAAVKAGDSPVSKTQ